jgi:hypothetical protein
MKRTGFAVVLVVISLATGVAAGPVQDQGFYTAETGGNAVLSTQWLSQSFQVGVEGLLAEAELKLFTVGAPPDDLMLYVLKEGTPEYVAVAPIPQRVIPAGFGNAGYITVAFGDEAAALPLNTRYELVLTSSSPLAVDSVNWVRDLSDPYAAGTAGDFLRGQILGGIDHGFVTFMEPQLVTGPPPTIGILVPEPPAFAGICAAAIGCAGALRRRR